MQIGEAPCFLLLIGAAFANKISCYNHIFNNGVKLSLFLHCHHRQLGCGSLVSNLIADVRAERELSPLRINKMQYLE